MILPAGSIVFSHMWTKFPFHRPYVIIEKGFIGKGHLLFLEQSVHDWMVESGIDYDLSMRACGFIEIIMNEVDAVLFKMRWL